MCTSARRKVATTSCRRSTEWPCNRDMWPQTTVVECSSWRKTTSNRYCAFERRVQKGRPEGCGGALQFIAQEMDVQRTCRCQAQGQPKCRSAHATAFPRFSVGAHSRIPVPHGFYSAVSSVIYAVHKLQLSDQHSRSVSPGVPAWDYGVLVCCCVSSHRAPWGCRFGPCPSRICLVRVLQSLGV
jgi:hypothetical protein